MMHSDPAMIVPFVGLPIAMVCGPMLGIWLRRFFPVKDDDDQ